MGNTIRDYLNHLHIISLEAIYEEYSREENREDFGYLLPIIKEVLAKRKSEENTKL